MFSSALMGEVRKNRLLFGLLIVTALAGGAAAIIQAYYLAGIIDGAFLGGLGIVELQSGLGALFAAIVARALFIWGQEMLGFRLAANIKTDLRDRLLARLLALGPATVDRESSGELVNTLVDGVERVDAYCAKYLPQLASAALIPPVILVVVFPLDLAAGLILLVTAPLIPVFMVLIGRWASRLEERQWGLLSRLSAHFFDVLQGLTTLKIFNRSKEQQAVIARLSDEFRDSTLGVLKVAFLSAFTLELLATLSTALAAVTVGLKLLYGQLAFRQAFFVLLLAPEYYLPLRLLGSRFHAGLAGQTAAGRIFRLLALAVPAPAAEGGEPFVGQNRIKVTFDKVSFAYDERPLLRSVSFGIAPGERLALVGPSGAGKTTLVDLLLDFIRPTAGVITVNGRDLSTITRADWLGHVAYLPQQPHLFHGTVADNIRFSLPGSPAEVEEAARAAGAHEFISRLAQGYDTVIGEGGQGLSGGEGQRIAIARAFYKKAPVLILDEAATGLDPQSEAVVREALSKLMTGRTVLVIAHRLSTACEADRILVVDEGAIVQAGRHDELVAADGLYRRLVTAYRGLS